MKNIKRLKISSRMIDIIEHDKVYPNRHIKIHKTCCKKCPSEYNRKHNFKDPETEEIKLLSKELIVKEFLFVCAWRPNKLCKGLCDKLEIDEKLIKTIKT